MRLAVPVAYSLPSRVTRARASVVVKVAVPVISFVVHFCWLTLCFLPFLVTVLVTVLQVTSLIWPGSPRAPLAPVAPVALAALEGLSSARATCSSPPRSRTAATPLISSEHKH